MKVVISIVAGVCILCIAIIAIAIWLFVLSSSKAPTPVSLEFKVAQQKCDDYLKVACDNPRPSNMTQLSSDDDELSRISGGKPAVEGMFPHMSFIVMLPSGKACGGSLISENFVMTAAHCVLGYGSKNIKVILGTIDIEFIAQNARPKPGTFYNVNQTFIHSKFNRTDSSTWDHDIALIRLAANVTFGWNKRPICLNTNFSSINTKNTTTSGWGSDETGNFSTTVLQVLDQETEGEYQKKCFSALEKGNQSMICAAHDDASKSVCQGDSGGPLQTPLKTKDACPNTYEQLGIVSYGLKNCTVKSNEPRLVLFTKVDRFIDWIVQHVWPEELKKMRDQK